jgi:5-methylthioadenosine/S-adenosylhomocysteine deaminase
MTVFCEIYGPCEVEKSEGLHMQIIRGSIVFTMNEGQPPMRDGAVVIEGTDIVAVGPFAGLIEQYPGAQILGSEDHWVLPGLVNAHCHAAMVSGSFRQGITDLPLERWLLRLYNSGMLDGQMAMAYWNTLNQNAQLIRSGVTCTSDFYYGDGSAPYLGAEHGLKAYRDSGMRVALFLSALDKRSVDNGNLEPFLHLMPDNLAERARAQGPILYNLPREDFLAAWMRAHQDFHDPQTGINVFLGPDGPVRCTAEFLADLKAIAGERGIAIQMHLLETKYQRLYGQREMSCSLVRYLDDLNFLGPRLSLAHCVWLSHEDMELIAQSGASVVHNASSNLRLCDGIAPVLEMLDLGVNVALGTDNFGFSDDNDFIEEMRLAALLHRVPSIEGRILSGQQILEIATINGARALGMEDIIGSLTPGKRADLITLSSKRMLSPFMNPLHQPQEILWRRARREDVQNVWINGKLVMQDGKLTTIDMVSVENTLREWYTALWSARGDGEQAVFSLLAEVDPYVIQFFRRYEHDGLKAHYIYNAR